MNNINEKITKRITFTELHDLSIKNKDKYNQNVFTEKLLEDKPKIKDDVLKVKFLMEHNHHNGEEVPTHFRTSIHTRITTPHTLLQDMSIEQWNNLESIEVK